MNTDKIKYKTLKELLRNRLEHFYQGLQLKCQELTVDFYRSNFKTKISIKKIRTLKKKNLFFWPMLTQGFFLTNVSPFGPAVWPAIA